MRLLWIFLVLAVAVLIPFFIWGEGFQRVFTQEGSVAWLLKYGRWAWAAGVGLLVLDLFLPIPETAVVAALGFVYGPIAGGLISAVGLILSGLLAYGLCRLLGRRVARLILGDKDLERSERLFRNAGGWLVVLSRWLPVFPEVIACLAGLTRMPALPFVTALVCGSTPLAFLVAAIGHAGGEHPVLVITLSAVLPVILWLAVQPLLKARQAPDRA